jgi:copper chaperone CopZ
MELPGVAEATTSMELQTATIRFDPAQLKPSDAIDAFTGRFRLSIYEGEVE